jgi:hypothetical protein
MTGKQILRPELVKEMLRPQLNPEQQAWLNLPMPANNMQVLLPGVEKQWGLGFLLMPKGAPSGRGNGTACWAGETSRTSDGMFQTVSIFKALRIPIGWLTQSMVW